MDREQAWADMMRAGLGGDAAAYERLLGEVAGALRVVARRRLARMGLDPSEAEDVVQEALIAMHTKRHTWDEARPILPWVHAIARHKLLDAARRSGRARRAVVDWPVEELADRAAAPEARRVLPAEAERMLGLLPERQGGVVRALAVEGRSVADVARALGVGEGAVRVAMHRGLARLARLAGGAPDGEARADADG